MGCLARAFQSPQWGSNSKGFKYFLIFSFSWFQSPQWGSNSKVRVANATAAVVRFQSPQWGSNSKGVLCYRTH